MILSNWPLLGAGLCLGLMIGYAMEIDRSGPVCGLKEQQRGGPILTPARAILQLAPLATEDLAIEASGCKVLGAFKVTAYCPDSCCCGVYADGITATGTDARTRGVAVDPRVIPYGTRLRIPGYGEAVADDCGGAIKGNRLDLRFPTHQAALRWGVQELDVEVLP